MLIFSMFIGIAAANEINTASFIENNKDIVSIQFLSNDDSISNSNIQEEPSNELGGGNIKHGMN